MTSINEIIEKLVQSFKIFDLRLTQAFKLYLQKLVPYKNPPFLTSYLTDFLKIIFYSLVIMIPFLFLKILHPYNRKVSIIIILLLSVIAFSVVGVFLGFFQLAWTF
ncbi:hypothetical protein A2865_03505 [Candidatus Woesebacteria bacterium RIFCSPHIGHO2_01_FULL_39_17]|uniref:Uncharacterized protein n=1 Tax=Candidatus Woesebacteria bacterium RIFCSPLOWO2_01_FULL_39_14 TaxID=1802518 RepID=A0A1F8BJT1_9BACT|nr:MAG: hypothetical protein A2865_03505 [Candidatus Woesebacteria bacterium RIFCSPHIGHO2_01_FULL_39_17]OGM64334.1 MAG: hypothetical protein A3A52_05360 [Candidatus Woesebacteria bacterium RIFCSPLOWO2_01_FULL_39_14]